MSRQNGGLGLVDFQHKDPSLKASWVQIIQTDEYVAAAAFWELDKELKNDIWLCNIHRPHILQMFKDSFWRDVLLAWSYFNAKEVETENLTNQWIWLNSFILVANKPILY